MKEIIGMQRSLSVRQKNSSLEEGKGAACHIFEGLSPVKEIDAILTEIDRDPTGIFWG